MKLKLKFKKYNKRFFAMSQYINCYRKYDIDNKIIFLESQSGNNINGNIFYILKELLNNPKYAGFKVYLSMEKKAEEKFTEILKTYNLNPQLLIRGSVSYFRILSSAKYLFNDTSFMPCFIKKPGQVIMNTWHGTPLKNLGKKDNSGYHAIGNVQKNFVIADYLLYPSEYMMKHMVEDYMLENISDAKCVISGYPRNSVFFSEPDENIIESLKATGKQIIGYMPTWRGTVGSVKSNEETIHVMHYLYNIDKQLTDDQLLLVNLHPFVSDGINYRAFKHIRQFPKGYETYEVLNVCDTLITDYSSVFFDYAVKKKKIILFTYDEEEYLRDRGMYITLDSLPFPKVYNENDLIREINTPINYDDETFLNEYAPKECENASSKLIDLVLFNEENDLDIREIEKNGKENVLIYGGNLTKNGITTALFNLLNNIDLSEYNYYLTFSTGIVRKHKEVIKELPEGINYIPFVGKMNANLFEKVYLRLSKKPKREFDFNDKILDRLYKGEIRRIYGDIKFKHVIQYNGYEFKRQLLFGRFDCEKTIFVHSNMVEEIRVRNSQNPNVLRYAYNHYDNVVMVTEDMREPTKTFCFDESKIKIANNIIDYKKVLEKSKEEMKFDDDTKSTHSLEEIQEILDSDSKVLVTVGRFSPEKGHMRMMDTFNRLWKEDNSIYLMIIGGHGVLHSKTIEHAKSLECADHIIIVRSLSNPFAFVKKCDGFVFTSFYEAFGLVLAEADILGVPVMSTDILGPRGFMQEHGGLLVSNDEDGIYDGMKQMIDGKVKPLGVDYEKYNQNAIHQFRSLLTK